MLQAPLNDFFSDEDRPNEAYHAINDTNVLEEISKYNSLETPVKYIAVKKLVEKIIQDGGKVVVWATFLHTIHGLKSYLSENGIMAQELYGAIPVEQGGIEQDPESEDQLLTRERIIREFQMDECPYKVILANPFAVAESISLHKACHNAIYIERSFNAAHYVQSKDRIHRYGLKPGTQTNYYFVISRNSVDETIDERLNEKERRMTEIMESMPIPLFDNVTDDVGDEDIKALIRDYVRRTKKI
jgi:SNF2 family DNA or RNA helicase